MRTDDLDFDLPPELIAQAPTPRRAESRLLHYRREGRAIEHRKFSDLPGLLREGDLLVFNDARVVPARFFTRKETGGLVEGLFLSQTAPNRWRVLLKNFGHDRDRQLHFGAEGLVARVVGSLAEGEHEIELNSSEPATQILGRLGRMPLPPYIKREKLHDVREADDRTRYQTVYARTPGAVAAPTAGLHFTPELLAEIDARGVERAFVTLHVGLGTFKPVTADQLSQHVMHREAYTIDAAAADALNGAKRDGRRIVAVGTTSARVLESQPSERPFEPVSGETGIFIYPPYTWRHVGAMVTNFHLPRSTLIALVAAMVGLEEQRRIYQIAIEQRYRFFSYGDAMLVE
jgi:S-adenosylmethionine:tRNA ribosyltransferase-isomerase